MNGIIAGVQESARPREGVAVLINNVWHSVLIDCGKKSGFECWANKENVV